MMDLKEWKKRKVTLEVRRRQCCDGAFASRSQGVLGFVGTMDRVRRRIPGGEDGRDNCGTCSGDDA